MAIRKRKRTPIKPLVGADVDEVKGAVLEALAKFDNYDFRFVAGEGLDSIHMQLRLIGKLKPISLDAEHLSKLPKLTKKYKKLVGKKVGSVFNYSGLHLIYMGCTSKHAYVKTSCGGFYRLPHLVTSIAIEAYSKR